MPLSNHFFKEALATGVSVLFLFALAWYYADRSVVAARWILGLSLLIFIVFVVAILMLALKPRKLEQHLDEDLNRGESGDFYLVGAPLTLFCSFLLTSFCIWRLWGVMAYTGGSPNVLSWFVYLIDNLVRAACLDFAESFRLQISSISHTSNVAVCILVFAFRTTVSVALISVVFRTWRRLRDRRSMHEKVTS